MPLVLLRVGAKMAAKHLTTYEIPATPGTDLPLPLSSYILTSAHNIILDGSGQYWVRPQAIIITRVAFSSGSHPTLTMGSETAYLETAMPVSTIDPNVVGLKSTEPYLAYPTKVTTPLPPSIVAKLKKPRVVKPRR